MVANGPCTQRKGALRRALFRRARAVPRVADCEQRREHTMNNTHPKRNDDERLIELAKARAAVLRREAIDDF